MDGTFQLTGAAGPLWQSPAPDQKIEIKEILTADKKVLGFIIKIAQGLGQICHTSELLLLILLAESSSNKSQCSREQRILHQHMERSKKMQNSGAICPR